MSIMITSIRGSIHQGHEAFSEHSRGRQCAFMSLAALLFNRSNSVYLRTRAYGHKQISMTSYTYIEDITRWREDMNFMFEWQQQYLTSERSERVRYCSCHENIKFISSSHRVMFFLLYGD